MAQHSLAHWLSDAGASDLPLAAGFAREHVLNMMSELHGILGSYAARYCQVARSPRLTGNLCNTVYTNTN